MLAIDHLAIWTAHRDRLAKRLVQLTGFPVLDGYAPEGVVRARGVRFVNDAFLDLHQVSPEPAAGEVLLGLRGSVDRIEALALQQAWGVRVGRWQGAEDGSPWSILSFRRNQGLLNKLFVIEYATEPAAWASPVFDKPLYRQEAPITGPSLRRIWLATSDLAASGAVLEALGFRPGREIISAYPPRNGRLYRGRDGDLVLCGGEADAVVRLDLGETDHVVAEPFGERLTLVAGETA
jgi:hypothetical protein